MVIIRLYTGPLDKILIMVYSIAVLIRAVRETTSNSHPQYPAFGTFIHIVFQNTMKTGKIARLTDRGFGFISIEGEEKDLFFHANELVEVEFNDLREGDEVTFELVDGPKGPAASQVRKA